MNKKLSEMTLEELWILFPIILKEHNPEYKKWYNDEKKLLLSLLENKYIKRLSHIGSTAVEGLIAKPTIDILIETSHDVDINNFIIPLLKNDWTIMSNNNSKDFRLSLNKGYTPEGFAKKVYHLHIRPYGDNDELYFRDYLIKYPNIAKEYEKLKLSLMLKYKNNRNAYTESKTDFIKKYTSIAKNEFKNRYI
ncbi:GrpB family protein [Oceanotoga sp. DSM 15011]|uniref:GrpB family protein n=1 Tax=Oceanotoga sp. DSM 15011 TaxID=2984951 RepID=UPI0021F474BE|nr:GrpB family protein [Oceanotoga sp. DSM 15011]UYP00575.1 GrpB family protein [Oceanotoga sp. DSM 15011]